MPRARREAMVDRFGRRITDLRISLTQRCNMNCFFCHREGEADTLGQSELEAEHVYSILEVAASLGIETAKFTGGEPLVHPDLMKIVSRASQLMREVSLTTNGYFLEEMSDDLRRSGLHRVNVSLHSLDRHTFQRITGIDGVGRVLSGIASAVQAGLRPVKINMVVLNGINSSEVEAMMEFAADSGTSLRLIELIPLASGQSYWSNHDALKSVERRLRRDAVSVKSARLNERPLYTVPTEKGMVEVELVRSVGNPAFCANCSRLRVTSDAKLKPCLMRNDNLVDIRPALSRGDREAVRQGFWQAVRLREPFWR